METSVALILRSIIRRRSIAASIIGLGVMISIGAALLMRPVYRSEVVVLPIADQGEMSDLAALAGDFGPLMAIAGMPLGKGGIRDEAMGVLRSRHLIERFVQERNLLPVLFANEWDSKNAQWLSDESEVPTIDDAIYLFDRKIRQIREDIKSGLVTLRIEWTDRQDAAAWANGLVALANEDLRSRAIEEAASSLRVLEEELKRAQSVELRMAISRLIEAQVKARTLASVRKEYAFKLIDPARVSDPDRRARPNRTLMVLIGAMAGALIAAIVCVWMDQRHRPGSVP